MAAQTARLINVQCGTEADPSPAKPENCMTFDWVINADKITVDDNPEATMREQQERIKATMRNHVAATGGRYG